jgi:hypothetical protein
MELNIRRWLIDRYTAIDKIREFSPGHKAGIAFRIIQDMETQGGVPFEICTLAEVLEVSLGTVWAEITILAQLTEYLLRGLSQKKALKRNEGTWLAFQISYLQALHQVLTEEANLKRPWLDRAIIPAPSQIINEETGRLTLKEVQLQGLLKNLRPGRLTDTQAQQALSLVADSLLVQQMNNATIVWLVANGAEEPEAKLLTQRLVNSLPGYLLIVIANNAPPLAQLQKFVRLGNFIPTYPPAIGGEASGVASSTVGDKIDLGREYYRASFLQNFSLPLFMESFGLKDIYVPLTGLPMEDNDSGQGENIPKPVDLTAWTQQQLNSKETIAVIESESGYGKTSFCQVFAAQVARELYPNWMPILINLRDIRYGSTFLASLKSALPKNLHPHITNWLEQDYPRCLLLLDGLDELPPIAQISQDKRIFIQQLLKFQAESKHKIVLTSRLKTLSEIAPELIPKSQRITIQPLDVDELRQWFQQWATVQSLPIAQNFFTFLKQAGIFASQPKLPQFSILVRQPLMLYLLGVLHRDGLLDDDLLQLAAKKEKYTTTALLWEIYDRLSRWLLGYPHFEGIKTMLLRVGTAHINRTPEAIANLLASRHPQDVLAQMQSISLKILHSDRQQINLPKEIDIQTLPSFHFRTQPQPTTNNEPPTIKIEFSHPKLGEYLCAQAIISQLQTLTKSQRDAYGKITFVIDRPQAVAQQLYNLLGYGVLSPELEELVLEGLKRAKKHEFSLTELFQRLESFWRDYCQGRWLDEGIAHQAVAYFHTLQNPINVERVNAAVGLNVFLLLCAMSYAGRFPTGSYANTIAKHLPETSYSIPDITFWPCGHPLNPAEFQPTALIELISRTAILHKHTFINRTRSKTLAGLNLSGVSLLQGMLSEANLEGANLVEAELIGANLTGANLQRANLTSADFTGANLTSANLTGANLTGANLTGANLTGANLTGANLNSVQFTQACLLNAILDSADKELAAINGALFAKDEFPTITTMPSYEALINQVELELTDTETQIWTSDTANTLQIETAEGIPTLPYDDDDYAQAETVIGGSEE